ncbi:MAG: SRPBCC family protein [Bacteroidota bacterium]
MQNRSYSFVTIWKLRSSLQEVWHIIYEQEKWPEWWKGVLKVEVLEEGDENDIGKRMRLTWRSILPYNLVFDIISSNIEEPFFMEGVAYSGELQGKGLWHFKEEDGITTVQYNWDVKTTKKWMNIFAPLLRPLFKWNHDVVMKWGAKGLAKKLNVELVGY